MATARKNPEMNAMREWFATLHTKRIRLIRLVSQIFFFGVFNGIVFGLPRTSFPVPISLPAGSPFATVWGAFDAMQLTIATGQFPFLVLGIFFVTGAIFGRLTCGWACPVGFWQDFLTIFPLKRWKISRPANRDSQEIGGFILIIVYMLVIFFGFQRARGALIGGDFWTEIPYGVIDPAGTMFVTYYYAAIWGTLFPDQGTNIFAAVGTLFIIKTIILFSITAVSIKVPRAYCRWICPTGLVLGSVSKHSIITMKRDPTQCEDGCNKCEKACPMGVPITEEEPEGIANSLCTLCGNCVDACPSAMSFGFRL